MFARLLRRLFLEQSLEAYSNGKPSFDGEHTALSDRAALERHLWPTGRIDWVVYVKCPFAGPESMLKYWSR